MTGAATSLAADTPTAPPLLQAAAANCSELGAAAENRGVATSGSGGSAACECVECAMSARRRGVAVALRLPPTDNDEAEADDDEANEDETLVDEVLE